MTEDQEEQEERYKVKPTPLAKLTYVCDNCGHINKKGMRVCTNCGFIVCPSCKD